MKVCRIQVFQIMIFMKRLQKQLNLRHHKYFIQYTYLNISKTSSKAKQILST